MSEPDNRKVQILAWPCCKVVYAVAAVPHCYTDKDWLKSLRRAAKDGDVIDFVAVEEFKAMDFGKCKCQLKLEL